MQSLRPSRFCACALHLAEPRNPRASFVLHEVREEERFPCSHDLRDAREHIGDLLFRAGLRAHRDDVAQSAGVPSPDAAGCDTHADDSTEAGSHDLLVVEVLVGLVHLPHRKHLRIAVLLMLEGLAEDLDRFLLLACKLRVVTCVRLEGGGKPPGNLLVESDEAHATLGDCPAGAVAVHLAREDATYALDCESEACVLEHRTVPLLENVQKVVRPVITNLRDVRVETDFERIVAALGTYTDDCRWAGNHLLVRECEFLRSDVPDPLPQFATIDLRLGDEEYFDWYVGQVASWSSGYRFHDTVLLF